jgi:carbon storage regulator
MLVLIRKLGESLIVGGNIRITLVSIRGHRARIGIDAPNRVSVLRHELRDCVQRSAEIGSRAVSPTSKSDSPLVENADLPEPDDTTSPRTGPPTPRFPVNSTATQAVTQSFPRRSRLRPTTLRG